MENILKFQNTKEQLIIKDNPIIPQQFVNAFIEENCENQNKIPIQLSSSQYRNADKNVTVQFRMRGKREPTRVSYKIVTRLYRKKKCQ